MGLEYLFGDQVPLAARFVFAFVAVIALIAFIVFVLRRFGPGRLAGQGGRRGNRLGVLDVAPVDGQRRLVIVRRDAVEHLIMIGGPNDLLIESHIVRAEPPAARPMPTLPPTDGPRKPAAREADALPPARPPQPDPSRTAPPHVAPLPAAPAPVASRPPAATPTLATPASAPAPVAPAPSRPPSPRTAEPIPRHAAAAPASVSAASRPATAPQPALATERRVTVETLDEELNSILGKLKAPPKT